MTILPTPKYENVKQKQRESFGGAGRCHQWNGSRNFLNKYLQLIVHLSMVCIYAGFGAMLSVHPERHTLFMSTKSVRL